MSVPRYWREIKYRSRLVGTRCEKCGEKYFPHRSLCRKCGARNLKDYQLCEKGKIVTFTVIRRNTPPGFEMQLPYIIGVVQLDEGVKLLSQIVDCEPGDIYIGMPVELAFRKVRVESEEGIIEYGFKFRPKIGQRFGDSFNQS